MVESIQVLAIAILLDLLLGDPEFRLHPVRIIGYSIQYVERLLKPVPINETLKGIFLASLIPCTFFFVSHLLIRFVWTHGTLAGTITSGIILYFTLGLRSLGEEAMVVANALDQGDLGLARIRLARIVGRETKGLDATEISRAAIETVGENFVDAVLAPLFYWAIGGAALAVFYRAVNTLDAMVGYKDNKYKRLGWASARLDDLLNFIPSRISSVFISMATLFLGKWQPNIIKKALIDGKGHESPNSGISEAAFSHALGVRLGGPTHYREGIKNRAFLNSEGTPPTAKDIRRAVKLLHISALMFALVLGIISHLKLS